MSIECVVLRVRPSLRATTHVPTWLPVESLPFVCHTMYLEQPDDTEQFRNALYQALKRAALPRRSPSTLAYLHQLQCPECVHIYVRTMLDTHVLATLQTEHFLTALSAMTRTWITSVTSIREIPRNILAAMLRHRWSPCSVFKNLEQNDWVTYGERWLDTISLGNLLILPRDDKASEEPQPDGLVRDLCIAAAASDICYATDRFLIDGSSNISPEKMEQIANNQSVVSPPAPVEKPMPAQKRRLVSQKAPYSSGINNHLNETQSVPVWRLVDASVDELSDALDHSSVSDFTDREERLVSNLASRVFDIEPPTMISTLERLDSYTLSASIYATIVKAHSVFCTMFGGSFAHFSSDACERGCSRILVRDLVVVPPYSSEAGHVLHKMRRSWSEKISPRNLTIGIPTVESMYKRVIDLLNDVHREVENESTYGGNRRRSRIPCVASHNFNKNCVYCALVLMIYESVQLYVTGKTDSVVLKVLKCENYVQRRLNSATTPEPPRLNGTSSLTGGTITVGQDLIQSFRHFASVYHSIKQHWNMALGGGWSSQSLTIYTGVERDALFMKQQQPNLPTNDKKKDDKQTDKDKPARTSSDGKYDADDSPLRISSDGMSPGDNSAPMEKTDRVYILRIEDLADVRLTVSILNTVLVEHHVRTRPLRYTISKSGKHTMMIVPKGTNKLLTHAVVPYLSTFRYMETKPLLWAKCVPGDAPVRTSCNSNMAHLQVLRNFYSPKPDMLYFSILWICRMLFNDRIESKSDQFCMTQKHSLFERYRDLPNILAMFGSADIVTLLSEPYEKPTMWCKRVLFRRRRRRVVPPRAVVHDKPTHDGPSENDGIMNVEECDDNFEDIPPASLGAGDFGSFEELREQIDGAESIEELEPRLSAAEQFREAELLREQTEATCRTKNDHRTVYFSPTAFSMHTALRAFLCPVKTAVVMSVDAAEAIWFTLRLSRPLWIKYRLLVGVICEMRRQPTPPEKEWEEGDPPPCRDQSWFRWVNYRSNLLSDHQHTNAAEYLVCRTCSPLHYTHATPYGFGATSSTVGMFNTFMEETQLVNLSGPPPPFLGEHVEPAVPHMSEREYFEIHEPLVFNAAAGRHRQVRQFVPQGYTLLPERSRVYADLSREMILDVLYTFITDQDIGARYRRRAFLGIHALSTNALLRPARRPRNVSADDMFLTHCILRKEAPPAVDQTKRIQKDNVPQWISRFLVRRSWPLPSLPTYSDHLRYNHHAVRQMYRFLMTIEAMFYLDYSVPHVTLEPGVEPPRLSTTLQDSAGRPIPNSYYGSMRQRHQITLESVLQFEQPSALDLLCYRKYRIPATFFTADVPESNRRHAAMQHESISVIDPNNPYRKMANSAEPPSTPPTPGFTPAYPGETVEHTYYKGCHGYKSCLPLWSSPFSKTTIENAHHNALQKGELPPFLGSDPMILSLITAYPVKTYAPPTSTTINR